MDKKNPLAYHITKPCKAQKQIELENMAWIGGLSSAIESSNYSFKRAILG